MFHLNVNPSPPIEVGRETPGQAVDSSAITATPGLAGVQHLVQLAEEGDRLEVLAAALLVRHPLARVARVVEVEHRGDGVDAQAVGVELAHPVEGVREQEVPHLVPREVEDQRAPVGMRAAARVVVLVERRAVEARERPLVAREVRRHPVEQHADPGGVERVDERPEVVGRAEGRLRREVAAHLVAPRRRVRVLHHRHQLDVGEAELGHVRHELRRRARATRGPGATSRRAPRRSRAAAVSGSAARRRASQSSSDQANRLR